MLKKRIIVRFFALIFSAVLLSQECFLQVPAQWEVNENQTVSFDSKYSLSNGSQKTSSFEVSYGSQQVRGYNEEEKNPYSLAGFLKHTAKGALEGAAENAVFYGVEKVFGAAKNVLSCFVAGTLIKTSEGLIPIEEIRVGDEVFAYNIETGETELKEVKQLFVHEENELVHLVINGEKIDTTTNHPFFVEDLGFISAKDLQVGDELRLYDGSTASVESIEIEVLDEPVFVYNFEVEDWHTYFVGELSILVHNMCEVADGSNYSNLVDSNSVGAGKRFTSAQKAKIIQQNMERNGGVIKSDMSGETLVSATKSQKGVTPNPLEVHIDHINPRSKGGSNSFSNAQVLARYENIRKSNK